MQTRAGDRAVARRLDKLEAAYAETLLGPVASEAAARFGLAYTVPSSTEPYAGQYSSASMMVSTRLVTVASAGSGEWFVSAWS